MKKSGFALLLLLSALSCLLLPLSAQEVRLDLSPNPVGVGDNITLVVELPAESVSLVDLEAVSFPRGIQVWRGPYL